MLQPTIEVRVPSLLATIWTYASGLGRSARQKSLHDPHLRVIARLDRRRAGSLTVTRRAVMVGNQRVEIAGVGNVLTRPEYRHSGVASAMLEAASELMRSNLAVEFGLLMCRREIASLYEKNGWRRVDGPTQFQQSRDTIFCSDDTMIIELGARRWPPGTIDLCGPAW